MKLTAPAALFALLLASTSPGSDPRAPAWDATDRYEERKVEGWRVLVDKAPLARGRQEHCDETLKQLVRQGKILFAGVSDMPAWVVAQANTLAELRGWTSFAGLQIEYSLIERTPERELLPMASALGLGVTAWSPLAGGVLTGKYAKKGGGGRYDNPMMKEFLAAGERQDRVVAAVLAVAKEVGRSPTQVALAWLRQRPWLVIPIVGARKAEQLADNMACLDLKLAPEQVGRLDEASRIEKGFPHDFYDRELVQGMLYGGMGARIDAARM
jgi:aryl-alcohol dehydrogenase-like predicted oxidoreductase